MTSQFPNHLQKIIDTAVLQLSDETIEPPDLSSLEEWLENDGWDDLVSGIQGSYIYLSDALEFFNDETLLENYEVDENIGITDDIRIAFARSNIESLIENSMDSFHSISLKTKNSSPAVLCITMYYHGQGGASFYGLCVCQSTQDYLQNYEKEIIMSGNDLSESEILKMWEK